MADAWRRSSCSRSQSVAGGGVHETRRRCLHGRRAGDALERDVFCLFKADASPCVQDTQCSCSSMVLLCHDHPSRRCKCCTAVCYHRVEQRTSPTLLPRLPQTPTLMARRSKLPETENGSDKVKQQSCRAFLGRVKSPADWSNGAACKLSKRRPCINTAARILPSGRAVLHHQAFLRYKAPKRAGKRSAALGWRTARSKLIGGLCSWW